MFSGQTLGALTSAQEGAGGWRQQMDSIVANSMISQLDSNGDGSLSLSEIQNALGGSSSAGSSTSASTSSNTVSTLDGLAGAFAAVDANGDGELSADELTNALGQLGQGQGQGGVHGHHGHHHHGGGDIDALLGNGGSTDGSTDPTSASGSTSTSSDTASTASSSTTSNTISTLDGLSTADVAQALQAFLNSLAQSQAANLSALAQQSKPTSVTA